jgi:hypothetical protein
MELACRRRLLAGMLVARASRELGAYCGVVAPRGVYEDFLGDLP